MAADEGVDVAVWVGGPRDGSEVAFTKGCRELHMEQSLYACDEDMCIESITSVIPVRMTPQGLRAYWNEAVVR